MSAVQRQLLWGISLSLLQFFTLMMIFFTVFPLSDWRLLWELEVLDVPFSVFALSVSLTIGLLAGIITGIVWRKQLRVVSDTLYEVEQGKSSLIKDGAMLQEIAAITDRIDKIRKQMNEQTKISQKMANEKVENQEKRIQEIVSQERNRLARELHDSVSQQLFAASMLMSAITETREETNAAETKQLKMVEEMINQSQLEMRALLLHLRPVALKGKSLQEGMKELLIELSQKVPMDITWKVEHISLDKGVEDHLFRILQESVSNTLRHAKASSLDVLLIQRDDLIILRVVDDGKGFDVETQKAGSYGLQNMYERAIEIGGVMKIVSLKEKGTRLEVKVPVMNKEGEGID
ncbi:sensor histidine kinase [Metabacillus iocasae]|uniref:Sensor histidine kinase n=1 Tax=Priestia iocasae TaxID=2291674 RepID=A0ABS2QXJ3_9BACI|nr:sensor histidine kinase [Metabacillus iocasae]MBM7704135.1 NarL family two-component system sensor histidine kinase LiaS [Metabacillus iocasae]